MSENDKVSRELQIHLDKETVGFPATESGSDLRLLQSIFTPNKAEASMLLSHRYESVAQIQERSGFAPAKVVARERSLDCLLPGRGCTVWFKQKLPARVAITYDVLCPTPKPAIKGLQPRDINNFWMATDPIDRDQGLFDSTRSVRRL